MNNLDKYGIVVGRGKPYEEALYSLALLYNICSNKMTSFLKKYDLSIGKLNILAAIRTHGGDNGLSQVDISKHLIVTPANMTKLIDKLEKEGMVKRFPMEGDRRVNIIKVTKKAETLLDGMWDEYSSEMSSLMDKVPVKDREIIAEKLVKWLGTLME